MEGMGASSCCAAEAAAANPARLLLCPLRLLLQLLLPRKAANAGCGAAQQRPLLVAECAQTKGVPACSTAIVGGLARAAPLLLHEADAL